MPEDAAGRPDLDVLTEPGLARMRAAEGDRVAQRAGRHWRATFPGFYQPVRLTAPLAAADVRRPAALCWGYRAALAPGDAGAANGTMPVYLMDEPGGFEEGLLSRNRRSDLRRARRVLEFRRLRDPGLLLERGHPVFMSAVERLGYWKALSPDAFRARVRRRMGHGHRLVVAALLDGELKGWLDAYAVQGVLFPEEIFIATDALRTGIGTGLYVEVLETGARSGAIHEVCNGLHTPEDPDLCHFKESLGFRLVHLPARAVIPAPVAAYLRARRPATWYRLTGTAAEGRVPAEGPIVTRKEAGR